MRAIWIVGPLIMIGLAGCAVALKSQAVTQLQAQCAAKGLQFVETGSKVNELVVESEAEVSGECVSPGDPRYVEPKPAPHPSI